MDAVCLVLGGQHPGRCEFESVPFVFCKQVKVFLLNVVEVTMF